MKTARPESGAGQEVFTKLLTIAAVIASSMSVYLFADHIIREAATQRFAVRADRAVDALREQMADARMLIRSLAGLFASSEVVERREFRAFVASLRPSRIVQALAWVPKLPAAERSTFEDQARKEGLYNFRLTEHSPDGGLVTAGARDVYYPVRFIEPQTSNRSALGFDLASGPARLKALLRARDSGQLVATGALSLTQNTGKEKDILIVIPVYQKEAPLRHIENRRKALAGFVLGAIRVGNLVDNAISADDFHTTIIDASSDGDAGVLFSNDDHEAAGDGPVHKESLAISGRRWTVLIHPASPIAPSWIPLMAVVTWLGLLAGISAFVGLLTYRRANQGLKDVNAKLESLNREKALILNSAGEGIYGLDQEGRITFANPKACELIGCTLAEVIGRPQHAFFCQDRSAGSSCSKTRDPIQATLDDGRMRQIDDERFRRRDGSTIPVEYRSTPVIGTHGQIEGAVVVFNDITARKQAAARQEEDARRLRQSNQELERFAYIASHDLQEPLRKMSSFCTILKEDHGERLDEEAHGLLDVITDAATRMQRLVQDLLAFSRLNGQQHLTMRPLPAAALVDQGIDACAAMIEETGGHVEHGDLPVVMGHENLLTRLFQNLVANSLKYRSDQPPRIRIEAMSLDGHWQFSISDNGIGIEPRHAERIFEFFERLRDKPECEGTGIGLAVCKRIVEQHGGRIWLDTSYAGGARFCFTLPASQHANGAATSGDVHDRDHAQCHAH